MLSQREMLGVKRSEEAQTKQSKSTFQLGFIKSMQRCGCMKMVWCGDIFFSGVEAGINS